MQRPVVDDLRVLFLGLEHLPVQVQVHLRELDGDCVMMPVVVADLRDLPPPLGGSEDIQVSLGEIPSEQKDQTTVADEESEVMSVHFCRGTKPS